MANILITGATGFVGRYLCDSLLEKGHNVKILVRRGANYSSFPVPLINILPVDWPYAIDENLTRKIDVVIHCANSPEMRNYQIAYDANVLSTKLLCRAAEKSKSFFIYISSQSANKNINSLYAKTKMASEEFIRNDFKGNWSIIRPGMVYGSGSSGLFAKMQNIVKKFKTVPLIDGGHQIIQPIHVLELVKAIGEIVEAPKKHSKKTYLLGDPKGISLRKFLEISAENSNPLFMNVPSNLILPAVKFSNKVMQLPITESNIEGLININKMDTSKSLEELNIELRPITSENINNPSDLKSYNSLRTVLIGAGKMGTLHFHNLKEFPQTNLVAIVEENVNKAKLLGAGKEIPIFSNITEAIKLAKPDLAVICTPTFTHLPILEECIKKGIHCFVEKPLSLNEESNLRIQKLLEENPEVKVSVGYLTSHYQHIRYLKNNLKKFGKIKKIEAAYYLSHIMNKEHQGWETKKSLSGGGVILNAAVHTLNTLCAILGSDYKILNKKSQKIFSKEVEDSLEAEILLGGNKVKLDFNWSIKGYPAAKVFIKIYTAKGELLIDNLGFMFKPNKGKKEFMFSDSKEASFNFAPDSGGSGFFTEMENFIDGIIKNEAILTSVDQSIKVEKLAHDLSK